MVCNDALVRLGMHYMHTWIYFAYHRTYGFFIFTYSVYYWANSCFIKLRMSEYKIGITVKNRADVNRLIKHVV
jgi:hypothetical protein